MFRKTAFAPIALLLLLTFTGPALASSAGADRSLSPYFFIEGGDSGIESFPLLETQVDVEISGVIARATVKQRYTNRGTAPIHARYVFPGSTRAAVHGLTMAIGDRVIRAQIKERQEARRVFETARQEGKSASLLEQQRPNVFTMQVANILPGDSIDVVLEYTELLVPVNAVYEFVYPAVVGPRYSGADEDAAANTWVRNPYLRKGRKPETAFGIKTRLAAGMSLQDVACPSHQVIIAYETADIANISLDGTAFGGDRDFILRYRLADRQIASGLMLYEGEDENFFLLMAQPPERLTVEQIPGREYLFVIDVSGSMFGFPLDTAKKLISELAGELRPEDRFNMLFFSGGSEVLSSVSLPATQENLGKALRMLADIKGGGGTELVPALRRALAMPATEGFSRSMILITDGYISAEQSAFNLVRDNLGKSNLFAFGIGNAVNRHLIEGLAREGKGEPFVVTRPEEAAAATKAFREYISAPVLTGIKADVDGFEVYDLEPETFPDMFAQRPLLVFGKWRGKRAGSITLSGTTGQGRWEQRFSPADVRPDQANAGLRSLWARERLAGLVRRDSPRAAWLKDDITALGLKYSLLTPHTSFVAVDELVRNPGGEGKNVAQPLPLPQGVSEHAVSVPEPDFWIMLGMLALLFAALKIPRYERIPPSREKARQ